MTLFIRGLWAMGRAGRGIAFFLVAGQIPLAMLLAAAALRSGALAQWAGGVLALVTFLAFAVPWDEWESV